MKLKFCLVTVFLLFLHVSGCKPAHENQKNYLIRVGQSVMTRLDYLEAFEVVKLAYPYEVLNNPSFVKIIHLEFLKQMTERMVLVERARELGLEIDADELHRKIAEIKESYSETEFDKMLLESAISYKLWEKEIKNRLLMDKVIEYELEGRIKISSEEILQYYENNIKKNHEAPEENPTEASKKENVDEKIITHLRRMKMEKAYGEWIKKLQNKYTIEIDNETFKKIAEPSNG